MTLALTYQDGCIEAGCDESGRGSLIGAVVAAAVVLPTHFDLKKLDDSKKLSERKRNDLRKRIEDQAVAWAVGVIPHDRIDAINILNASYEAMHKAIEHLQVVPELLLIDGNRFHAYLNIPHCCLVRGDARFASIAAASILAKTHRDELVYQWHEQYPHYRWNTNKGYATAEHQKAIHKHGLSPLHRQSFHLKGQLSLFH